ncbi:sensor histidine kinase [Haliscomenobacter sp.]|uniref:sensor histidine kinase n=1 Tax=Haliscomenobacter sp. TaxID=2717303 RepID=UPI0035933640
MKNIKPSIAADLLILLAFVLGINGGLLANHNPVSTKPQEERQALVATFKPYIESIAWVSEFLKGDSSSVRAHQLKRVRNLSINWLDTAAFAKTVPVVWQFYWRGGQNDGLLDVFKHNVFYEERLWRVQQVAYSKNMLLLKFGDIYSSKVIYINRWINNRLEIRVSAYELFPEKFKEPISCLVSLRKREQVNHLPDFLCGDFVNTIQKKSITKVETDAIEALGKRWLIQKKGEIFLNNRRAYRVYALEETTGLPGYFVFQAVTNFWVLTLSLEASNSNRRQSSYSLGEKKDPTKSRKLDYRWVLLLSYLGLGAYLYYHNRMKKLERAQFRTHLALNGLRAQLNPHFLFNSLASIQDLMNEDKKEAANRYFDEIARLLRYVVDSSKYAYMPLAHELKALEKYCSLEALRTPFQYSFVLSPDIDQNNTEIPTMLLQPFVENAILHGLRPGTDPKELKISIWHESDHRIGVSIIDNGIGIEEAQRRGQKHLDTRDHQGLATTQQRIDLLNEGKKEKITLKLIDRSHLKPGQTGTLVQLSIPL